MRPLEPCHTAQLFRPLSAKLITLLRELSPEQRPLPTVAGRWRVRDVAAHLLDGHLRRLSAQRDGHLVPPDRPIRSDRDLASFINTLNATGVAYAARLSTRMLTELLEQAGTQLAELFEQAHPEAPALYPVSWAGESQSAMWMDAGREYTEHWHHQMQIRDAAGRALLLESQWMHPLLEMSVRALPHTYAAVPAPNGAVVTLLVSGVTTGAWSLVREDDRWHLRQGQPALPDATVSMAADAAWRMFFNALSGEAVSQHVRVAGNADLAAPLLRARSVVV